MKMQGVKSHRATGTGHGAKQGRYHCWFLLLTENKTKHNKGHLIVGA